MNLLSWKLTAGLGVALLASAALNLHQHTKAAEVAVTHKAELEQAKVQAKLDIATDTLDHIGSMAKQARVDNAELSQLRTRIAESKPVIITRYRDRIKDRPVPVCQSDARQAAGVNEILHARP